MKILIIDDDTINRDSIARLLQAHGHEVSVAVDGLLGLRTYLDGDGLRGGFGFVLTDYQMPRKNGHVLLMDIRKLNPQQKMAMMSADPPTLQPEVADVPVLRKPFRIAALLALLEKTPE